MAKEFFCDGCMKWKPNDEWEVMKTDKESNIMSIFCKECVSRPSDDNLSEFNQLIDELKHE